MAGDADKALVEELMALHGEYMGKMRELERRQKDLMRRILQRLDVDNASRLLQDITTEATSEPSDIL